MATREGMDIVNKEGALYCSLWCTHFAIAMKLL